MPNYFQTFQEYVQKKMRHTGYTGSPQDMPEMQDTKPPIPNLSIGSIIRQRSLSTREGLTKYLFEFDIASHAIIIVLIAIITGVTIVKPGSIATFLSLFTQPEPNIAAVTSNKEALTHPFAKPVYASAIELNPSKIFSVDPDNVTLVLPGTPKRTVYGFFPYWMLEREKDISFDQLTAMSLFGLDVDGEGNIITRGESGEENPGWEMWNDPRLNSVLLRARKKRLTTEVTIKNFNNDNITRLVTSDEAQRRFIANAIFLVQSKSLSGVNIDFEYVGVPSTEARAGFTRLITNLRSEMRRQIPEASLSVDTFANAASVQGLFDIEKLAEQVDSLIIMGYDIHTPSGDPGPIAPLDGQMSILGFVQSYLEKVDPAKLILAIPYYGYDWEKGEGTNHQMLSYAEIVDASRDKTIQWDENAKSPFYPYMEQETNTERIVYFENVRSLGLKYDFINSKNLKGVGIWALGYDGRNTDLRNLLVEKFAK